MLFGSFKLAMSQPLNPWPRALLLLIEFGTPAQPRPFLIGAKLSLSILHVLSLSQHSLDSMLHCHTASHLTAIVTFHAYISS